MILYGLCYGANFGYGIQLSGSLISSSYDIPLVEERVLANTVLVYIAVITCSGMVMIR
jgi:hypothetical protein